MTIKDVVYDLKKLVAADLSRLFDRLEEIINPSSRSYNDFVLLMSRYNEINNSYYKDLVSLTQRDLHFSHLREGLINFINSISKEDLNYEFLKPSNIKLVTNYNVQYYNLPYKTYEAFIGRIEYLEKIKNFFNNKQISPLLCITGAPGSGKTSLALESAYQIVQNQSVSDLIYFRAIVWMTAQTIILSGGEKILNNDPINSLEDIYAVIAITLKKQSILRMPRDEQDGLIKKTLTENKILLIVDNFETISDDRVLPFLQSMPPPTKAILTSRFAISYPNTITLGKLSEEEGLDLIKIEIKRLGLDFTEKECFQLYNSSSGLPLVIIWSIAQIAYGFSIETTIKLLSDSKGDLLQFCFGRVIDLIKNEDPYWLLLVISTFATNVSREALSKSISFGEDIVRRDKGLTILKRLNLISQNHNRFDLLPITKRLTEHELKMKGNFVLSTKNKQIKYYKDFLNKYNPKQEPTPAVEPFWEEIENIRELLSWCYAREKHNQLVELGCALAPHLWFHGLHNELFEYAEWISKSAEIVGKWDAFAEINLHTSLAYMDQYRIDEMLKKLDMVHQAFNYLKIIPDELMETYLFARAAAAALNNDNQAKELFIDNLNFNKKLGIHWREAGTLYFIGKWAYDRSEWSESLEYFQRALEISQQYEDKRTMALVYSFLPEVWFRLGEKEKSLNLWKELQDFVVANGQATSKGQLSLGASEILLDLGDWENALIEARKALNIYTRLNRMNAINRVETIIKIIESKNR